MIRVVIDNGHGIEKACNASPDKQVVEYRWAREIASRLWRELDRRGISSELLVPEISDVRLQTRVARVNKICRRYGASNVVLVSIHNNAQGSGRWTDAHGFSVFVSKKASTRSKILADTFTDLAIERGMTGDRAVPAPDVQGLRYWTWSWRKDDIYILTSSSCPAVLTENGFMTNKEECKFLASKEGMEAYVQLHADALERYVKKFG